ncbi:hypothetical protein J3459_006284 [Metarhizium acridum]|uniref:uncharacterized protein n=1 Tax=Metarhizium acridum TaxID=92637 RepID=UPI001C6C0A13|nr:hypothetical protein J3458_005514 [Metarhizium acridum]KAG8427877.1 hypothetical protein J3459_006284 [Metarhizium acridum]
MKTNACDKYKQEALKLAAEKGHSSMVMMLLDGFADPANFDKLLDRNAVSNYRDSRGRTALILASERGYTSIVLKLLGAEASPNIQEYSGGSTALHFAVRNDHRSIIEVLHLAGADLDVQDHAGRTALLVAMEVIDSRIPSEDPYKVHLKPFRRKYLIFLDAERRVQGVGLESFFILRYLLSYRASTHIQDMLGQTALHWAVRPNLISPRKT